MFLELVRPIHETSEELLILEYLASYPSVIMVALQVNSLEFLGDRELEIYEVSSLSLSFFIIVQVVDIKLVPR